MDRISKSSAPDIRVFVHLAHGFGRASWKQRWDAGNVIGINHDNPYGYQQANGMGCAVSQSEDLPEGAFGRLLRLGVRALLGFDLLHAWRNRRAIFSAEVVWTHTESQALAVLALMRLRGGRPTLKLIAQTIWLADDWNSYSHIRRTLYRSLLCSADVLTVHSNAARQQLEQIFPESDCELVRYGIRADQPLKRPTQPMRTPIRVLTLGNDRHRDWTTFVEAFRSLRWVEARIVSHAKLAPLLAGVGNLQQTQLSTNEQLVALYHWADIVVVPLVTNYHASGITVIQEAVLFGVPVVCSDAGDLGYYFGPDELFYVPAHNATAMRQAVLHASADQASCVERVEKALSRMKHGDINSRSFVARHVEISRRLLGRP